MMQKLQRFSRTVAIVTLLLPGMALGQGTASTFPSRPVTLVVSAAAGGPNDIEARQYANKLGQTQGQPFVMDYKPGGGTTIGTGYVAKAAPDGHTLLVVTVNFTVIMSFYKDLPFDVLRDFAPVTQMSERTTVFMASPSFAPKNIREYIAYAAANPGKINFGTSGAGGISHLGGTWLHAATNTKVTFVHYKGAAGMVTDVLAGRVDVAPAAQLASMPYLKSGKIRALAIMQDRRSPLLPGVQTVAEQGVPGYNYPSWVGFVAPAATPPAIVNRLHEMFAGLVKAPDVVAAIEADGGMLVGSTPEQFRKRIVAESALWQKLVRENGITLTE